MNRPPALPGVTLTYGLFQKGRVLAQDGVADGEVGGYPVSIGIRNNWVLVGQKSDASVWLGLSW